jgi:hypothetical protein
MRRALDQRCRERLAAKMADIYAFSGADLDGVKAGRLPAYGVNPGRSDLDVVPITHQMMKQAFGDWAAANIARTDEKDAFHDARPGNRAPKNLGSKMAKSIGRRPRL